MGRLAGKTALVTAAAQGIGRATATMFANEGAHVIASDINADGLSDYAHPNIETMVLDVCDQSQVADLPNKMGSPDILFNCAGFVHAGTILDCSEEDWGFAFDLNVTSMFRMIKTLLPGMVERGSGSIINMSSVVSSVKGVPNRFAYGASKAAVIGITKCVAADFMTKGVRCNAIAPGTVDSPSLHDRLRATGDYDQAMKDFIARQPMGRIGRADEIAYLATYLGSDEAAFTTGTVQIVDGGWAI